LRSETSSFAPGGNGDARHLAAQVARLREPVVTTP
jgi:hypothetical protein